MIRFITEENFPYLDAQIERVYQRRRAQCDAGLSHALICAVADDIALLRAPRRVRSQHACGSTWLRRLRSDLADLLCAAEPCSRGAARERGTTAHVEKSEKAAAPSARRSRAPAVVKKRRARRLSGPSTTRKCS